MTMPAVINLENDRCGWTFTTDAACDKCAVDLYDKRTRLRRQSSLVETEVLWDTLQRIEIQPDVALMHVQQKSATQASFAFLARQSRIAFRLELSLEDEEFTATIPWSSIEENRPHFRLMGIRPLPGLLRTSPRGSLLAPIQSGVLIHPGHHRAMQDAFLIYGQQHRWEDMPMLPVCAMLEPDAGLAILAERGDCDTQCEVRIGEDHAGIVGFSCRYRYLWPDPVDPIDRVLRYVLLDESNATYSGVGRRVNRFLRETHGMKTLAEKCEQSPALRYAARAMTMKTFHGMKDLNQDDGFGTYHLHQTFAETRQQLHKLKQAEVEQVYVQLVGWNMDGHDGRWPTRFPIDPRPGGEAGFRELIRAGQQLGYQMQVHNNYADSTNWQLDAVVQTIWGHPLPRSFWGGGPMCGLNPRKLGRETAIRDMLKLRDMGVAGMAYLDSVGLPLEVDYDPLHGGPRRSHAEGIAWIVELAREVFSACGVETGFFYVAKHADYIGSCPLRNLCACHQPTSPTPIHAMIDERVPLWHIAFHGMLVHTINDESSPSTGKLLEAAETGGSPRSDFTGEHPDPNGDIFAMQWDDRLLPVYRMKYDILIRQLGDNAFAFIVDHRKRDDARYQTTFSNGCVVDVDYTARRLLRNGREIPIPEGYELNLPMRRG
ncbi:MAG: hypothetical protein IT440_00535 [Phycisphaeraceae bacterium]|nr:hypothetical protein [Phycisphaeraceae bacterium]